MYFNPHIAIFNFDRVRFKFFANGRANCCSGGYVKAPIMSGAYYLTAVHLTNTERESLMGANITEGINMSLYPGDSHFPFLFIQQNPQHMAFVNFFNAGQFTKPFCIYFVNLFHCNQLLGEDDISANLYVNFLSIRNFSAIIYGKFTKFNPFG